MNRERSALADGGERGFEHFEFCIVGGIDDASCLLPVAAEAFGQFGLSDRLVAHRLVESQFCDRGGGQID